ncbi:hypothetical protein OTU49_003353, partial [Cherax quadricarinatus]
RCSTGHSFLVLPRKPACVHLFSVTAIVVILTAVAMTWPSAYGYKYTPIGLRQREKKDDYSGTRSICTTVHLPQGGHLLDIERQYGIDGSMSKRETQNMEPSSVPPVIRQPLRAASPPLGSDFDPRSYEPRSFAPTDFERQADDIIANFRARQGLPLEKHLWRI